MGKTSSNKTQSKAKKIYNAVSTAIVALLFVFLVIVVAIMLVQKGNGGENKVFGYYMFNVLTDSMSGTIEPGDVILAKEVEDVSALKVGDIITFKAPNGNYNETHRIIEVVYKEDNTVDYFRTQGDNASQPDNWQVKPENVKAIFVRKSAFIGGLRTFLSNWYGYVVLIAIPMCAVCALIIVGFVRDKIALEREKDEAEQKENLIENLSEEDKKKLLEIALNDIDLQGENEQKTHENATSTAQNPED